MVLADGIAPFSGPVFHAAATGGALNLFEAWGGALAYTFQLYFDFSGYSDMAIGLSRLFGVKLPLNFNSPYKAVNIIDFWRRWHMTLSRFLRDYLYFPLGGNRKGPFRRYLNLLTTMLLGGLWHGAGWTFVLWGGLHGFYLVINHAWHGLRVRMGYPIGPPTRLGRIAGMTLTFLVVVVAWVFFRAPSLQAALNILSAMFDLNGVVLPGSWYGLLHWRLVQALAKLGIHFGRPLPLFEDVGHVWRWIAALWVLAWFAPNTQQIMAAFKPALEEIKEPAGYFSWRPNRVFAWLVGCLFVVALFSMNRVSEFLYFQF
ncbi:probable poly(beta-D-mannuronate) O-acetylase [Sulfuriferula multivorans]|uniref:Probable alginate O-acetylase AlgI n=1 Tax=Sulfuriferula multivorans TaxID=1559896 RepID=A0A401JZB5_9PROT|nr:probable poly(beta-D-mannuronate) O-acetylase [Sulfuriferula multivorans]